MYYNEYVVFLFLYKNYFKLFTSLQLKTKRQTSYLAFHHKIKIAMILKPIPNAKRAPTDRFKP